MVQIAGASCLDDNGVEIGSAVNQLYQAAGETLDGRTIYRGSVDTRLFLFFDAALTVCGIEQQGWYVGPQPQPNPSRPSNLLDSCVLSLAMISSEFGPPLGAVAADWVGCAGYGHSQASGVTLAFASPQHTAVEQVRRAARVGLRLWSDIPALLLDATHSQGSVEEEEESGVN